MNIILVRHVETEANRDKIFSGWTDYPVTKVGKIQRIKLGREIKKYEKIQKMYSSPLPRTKYTAIHIKRVLKKKIEYSDILKEVHFGKFEGLKGSHIAEEFPDVWQQWNSDFVNYRIPEGESILDLKLRLIPFLENIIEKNEDCIIVSHGAAIQIMITYLLNFDVKDMWRFQIKNGSFAEIEYNDGFGFLKRLNPI